MRFRHALQHQGLAGLLAATLPLFAAAAQSVDPAIVGERLQRLNATVESLELTAASQRRQIESLSNELHKVREETNRELTARGNQRPWAEDIKRHDTDLKRLADAIAEVDRKRIADHEQVLKILGELRKSITTLAETPPARVTPPKSSSETREPRSGNPGRSRPEPGADKPDKSDKSEDAPAVKAVPYTVGKGESLGIIIDGFNSDAKKKGYQTLSVQQVMKFNKITNANRVREGMVLNLPLYPKSEKQ